MIARKVSTDIRSALKNDRLLITGELDFYQRDTFADPLDVEELTGREFELPGATPYPIIDLWRGALGGEILKDRSRSRYTKR